MAITAVIKEKSGFSFGIMELQMNEIEKFLDDIRLLVAEEPIGNLSEKIEGKNFKKLEVSNGISAYCHESIKSFNPPKPGSDGSAAVYHIWDEPTGILYQEDDGDTTINFHTKEMYNPRYKQASEVFYNTHGKCKISMYSFLDRSYKELILPRKTPFVVGPHVAHQLHALDGTCYNIILMVPGVGKTDHHFVKSMKDLIQSGKLVNYVE